MNLKRNALRRLFLMMVLFTAFSSTAAQELSNSVGSVLDKFHMAASQANGDEYFKLMAVNAVFIGTDGSERWTKSQFKQFAMPYFSKGTGWTYHPRNRNIDFSDDGKVAWFDEMLDNTSYGECRGTGVLILTDNGWQIAQYHLTIPIPNSLAKSFVAQINAHKS
jgi:hypothetical protein